MKYIELLNIAKSKELNVTKLFIANEVDILIRKYVKERNDKICEYLCSLVYEYYLMIDYSSINDLANVIYDLYFINKKISEKKYLWKTKKYVFVKKLFMGLGKASKHDMIWIDDFRQNRISLTVQHQQVSLFKVTHSKLDKKTCPNKSGFLNVKNTFVYDIIMI